MPKLPTTIPTGTFLIAVTFFITLGLAVSLQGVFGLNITGILTGPLNLGTNKIINVGAPTGPGDVATWDFVNSAAGGAGFSWNASCV